MGKNSLTDVETPLYLPQDQGPVALRPTSMADSLCPPLSIATRFSLVVCLSLLLSSPFTPESCWARDLEEDPVANAALGVTSLLATIPYGATKLLYAGLGAIVGGFSYVLTLGNTDTAELIWEKSLGGTYVLSPEHLTGEERIHFVGPDHPIP